MMPSYIIFVDANIYLDCYPRNYESYRELLSFIVANKKSVLFTQITRDEFRRNRSKTYIEKNIKDKPKFYPEDVRSHDLWEDYDDAGREVRKLSEEIKEKMKEYQKKVNDINTNNFLKIVLGKDDVSTILRQLDDQVAMPTPDQLQRARLRREIGNPPGKQKDVLGDQLSWEQLLDEAKGKQAVWIVSNDGDYFDEWTGWKGKLHLKSMLIDELRESAGVEDVYCYKTLSDFFDAISKSGYDDLILPSDSIIAEAQREVAAATSEASSSLSEWYNYLRYLKSNLPGALAEAEAELDTLNKKLENIHDPEKINYEGEPLQFPHFLKGLRQSIDHKSNLIRTLKAAESFDGYSMESAQAIFMEVFGYQNS